MLINSIKYSIISLFVKPNKKMNFEDFRRSWVTVKWSKTPLFCTLASLHISLVPGIVHVCLLALFTDTQMEQSPHCYFLQLCLFCCGKWKMNDWKLQKRKISLFVNAHPTPCLSQATPLSQWHPADYSPGSFVSSFGEIYSLLIHGPPKVIRKTCACAFVLKGWIFNIYMYIIYRWDPVNLKKASFWRDAFTLSEQVVPFCHNTF